MIAKKYKLPTSFFQNIASKRIKSLLLKDFGLFSVKVYKSENNFSRFAVAVSLKVSKKSVERNRLRRIFFDFFRKRKLYEIKERDFVFFVKKNSENKKNLEVEKELEILFKV